MATTCGTARRPENFIAASKTGGNSALYEKRYRQVQFWGNCGPVRYPLEFGVVEYRRITCASGQSYTRETSGWYKPTWSDDRTTDTVDHYVEVPREEAKRLWREQIVITRKVARGLRKVEAPHRGFAAT